MKICEECNTIVHGAATKCPSGHKLVEVSVSSAVTQFVLWLVLGVGLFFGFGLNARQNTGGPALVFALLPFVVCLGFFVYFIVIGFRRLRMAQPAKRAAGIYFSMSAGVLGAVLATYIFSRVSG